MLLLNKTIAEGIKHSLKKIGLEQLSGVTCDSGAGNAESLSRERLDLNILQDNVSRRIELYCQQRSSLCECTNRLFI
jgi:hypothetical protein